MRSSFFNRRPFTAALALLSTLPTAVFGDNVISTTGYSTCVGDPSVKVTKLDVSYNQNTRQLVFDVAGESEEEQKVNATLYISAYGKQVAVKSFNPCDPVITGLCPIPAGTFGAAGSEPIPSEYASDIPAIAFSVPDLDGLVKLELTNINTGEQVGCITSNVGNGKTLQMPAIGWVAGGVAAGALALSALAGIASGGHPGGSSSSPTFTETIHWFQGVATTGMLSVQYPQVYLSWTSNFAFSTGLVSWSSMQNALDNFRASTGGNLTDDNYQWLKNNVTLQYNSGTNGSYSINPRDLDVPSVLYARQSNGATVNVNGTSGSIGGGAGSANSTSGSSGSSQSSLVSGIQGYVETLSIPHGNTFMTVLLIFAIIIAGIIVLILLFKVILEGWTLIGKLPKWLESWRKRYWWRMAKAITNLVFLLYGTWTLYCIYQFSDGDSWAATILAAVTLAAFTALLAWFTWRIYSKAHEFKKLDGDAGRLYKDKETWIKYSLFYDNYKKNYYMFFVPTIIYMFAKGAVIAGGNGHGLVQAGGQIICEAIFLTFLLFMRPHQRKSGRWINIVIQVIRMASVVCVLVFVEELGIAQTTKTITGVVLIIVQASLTVVLALLIAINALITCIRQNPHVRKRKQAALDENGEEIGNLREIDALTPLDARNSLLMEPMTQRPGGAPVDTEYKPGLVYSSSFAGSSLSGPDAKGRYDPVPPREQSPAAPYYDNERSTPPPQQLARYGNIRRGTEDESANLVSGAARMGRRQDSYGGGFGNDYPRGRSAGQSGGDNRSVSRSPSREPRLPELDFGFENGGMGIAR